MTSMWIQSAPPSSSTAISSASFERSALRIDGAIRTLIQREAGGGAVIPVSILIEGGGGKCETVRLTGPPAEIVWPAAGSWRMTVFSGCLLTIADGENDGCDALLPAAGWRIFLEDNVRRNRFVVPRFSLLRRESRLGQDSRGVLVSLADDVR